MAKANRELITIEYCDSIGEFFKHDITENEAESLFFALQEVLDIEWGSNPVDDKPVLKSEWEELVDALKSIASSSCCDDCQEAKRIAEVALYQAGVVQSIPVPTKV